MQNAKYDITRKRPFIHGNDNVMGISIDILIALVPTFIFGIYHFGIRALAIVLISMATALLSEFLYELITKKKNTIRDLSAVVTGAILGLSLPSTVSLWIPVIGAAFSIIVVKQVFGGIGRNIVNPAIAGRVFLMLCFPVQLSGYSEELVSSATALPYLKSGVVAKDSVFNLIIGNTDGAIGEVSAIAITFGLIYLVVRKVIDWRIPVSILGVVAIVSAVFPQTGSIASVAYSIASGSVLFAAVFCATDPVTSPTTKIGKVVFGVLIGIIVIVIRYFGSYPEGSAFAILIGNLVTPLIDRFTIVRKKGGIL